jgi:selenocysteine-specific elongation factor
MHTMAGGIIIDPHPKKHGRKREGEIEALRSREEGGTVALLLESVASAGLGGAKMEDLARATSMTREELGNTLAGLHAELHRSESGRIFSADAWRIAQRTILEAGRRYQERQPLRWGMTREELRAALGKQANAAVVGELLAELSQAGEIALRGEKVRVGGGEIAFEGKAAAERDRIERMYQSAGLASPDLKEVLAGGRDANLAGEVVAALLDLEILIKITPEFLIHRESWDTLHSALKRIALRDRVISVGSLRDELGISRKYSVPILEYLDARRVTRREGDVRVLLET